MKKRGVSFTAFIILIVASSFGQTDQRGLAVIGKMQGNEGKRWAVCIGIDDYYDDKIANLKKARNDAKALGTVLKGNGQFDYVFVMTDDLEPRDPLFPTKFNIEQKLRNILDFASEKDLVVFSFSGHGISDKSGEGYLVSVDSRMDDKFATSVRVNDVVAKLAKNNVTKTLLLLDACREEMQESKGLSNEGLREARYSEAEVAATFYATKSGMFSYEDKESDFGVFTRFVVDGLLGAADQNTDKIVCFNELEAFVQDRVSDWSIRNGRSQKPYTKIYGERYGDLALSVYDVAKKASLPLAAAPATAPAATPAAAPVKKEDAPPTTWNTIPISEKRAYAPGVIVDGSIYYIGGAFFNGKKVEYTKAIEAFNLELKQFSTAHSINYEVDTPSVVSHSGKIYYSGGLKGLSTIDTFQVYDPATNTIADLPKMKIKRIGHGMAAIGDRIYVLGGFLSLSAKASSGMEYFDLKTGAWTMAKDLPVKQQSASAIAYEGKLYVFGGTDGKRNLSSIAIYDPSNDSWRISDTDLPISTWGMGIAELNGVIFLFGGGGVDEKGRPAVTNASTRIFAFDPKTERLIERKEKLPLPFSQLNCSVYDGKIYLTNGRYYEGDGYKQSTQILVFDPSA
jgi:N-acetylneuraminic acid mutarotase